MADRSEQRASSRRPDIEPTGRQDKSVSDARRRLVKGAALGLPAVLTLNGGAALAASSTPTRCLQNRPDTDPTAVDLLIDNAGGTNELNATGEWLRRGVDTRTYRNINTGDEIIVYLDSSAPSSSQWFYRFAANGGPTGYTFGQQSEMDAAFAPDANWTITSGVNANLALVLVDDSGNVQSYSLPSGGQAQPVMGSCWGSFVSNP